jgi:hypothetical protein
VASAGIFHFGMPREADASREDSDAPGARSASVEDRRGRLNEIARRVGVAPSTVRLSLKRLARAGFNWPLPAEMTDSALEAALFAGVGTKQGHRRHAEPDWAELHRDIKRKHDMERYPDGYRYSRFCEL